MLRQKTYTDRTLGPGSIEDVYVTFVKDPHNFFVQLESSADTLEKVSNQLQFADNQSVLERLTDGLQEFYTSPKAVPASLLHLGSLVAAKFSEDGAWYRGSILYLGQDATVEFVDFRNSEKVSLADLQQLDSQFLHILAQAICCCLDGVHPLQGQAWNVDAKDFLERLTENGATCKILGCKKAKYLVKLEAHSRDIGRYAMKFAQFAENNQSVTDELKATLGKITDKPLMSREGTGYACMNIAAGQTIQAYISFVESIPRFWVQFVGTDKQLDSMKETLGQHYGFGSRPALAALSPGQPCCALYDEDGLWYCAVVMSVHETKVNVHFVDYGNSELVKRENVKPISADLITQPTLALECCLEGFEPSSSDAAPIATFENMVTEKRTFTGGKNV
ncbi:hypothetical protein C0Q70_10303 [Pomacea canaliculata]|uniref:Tudor domain-containing protein n=1 Tax=Pomacea canaliculata TaxID=400727 RepID=A0A2T7PC85_POMCA|nr:hypothetical protein C0Q70_10303 [Pomacea canaliculata]